MEQKAFLKTVGKNLNCGKTRKREICHDIRADIEAAGQTGETWSEIEARMGNPREMAAEFNENMTDRERQQAHREKRRRIMAVIVPVAGILLILVGVVIGRNRSGQPQVNELGSSGIYSETMLEPRIDLVIDLINEESYEELLFDYCTAEVNQAVTPEQLGEVRQLISPDWGEYQRITSRSYMEIEYPNEVWAVAQVMVLYENCSAVLRLAFNEEMMINGLYIFK